MHRFSLKALRERWIRKQMAASSALTPAIVGKIAACVLIRMGRRRFYWPDVERMFVDNFSSLPDCARRILHLQSDVTGTSLAEGGEMLTGVIAGCIAFDFGHGILQVRACMSMASLLIGRYRMDFPDFVEWAEMHCEGIKN